MRRRDVRLARAGKWWPRLLGWTLLLGAGVVACSDEGRPGPPSDEPEPTRTPPAHDLAWSTCSLLTGGSDSEAECAVTDLPLIGGDPDGPTIGVFVKRYSRTRTPRGQLWLLNGGPGGSSVDFEGVLSLFLDAAPDLEVYLIDHRGTGRSGRLNCGDLGPVPENPTLASIQEHWSSCLDEIDEKWGPGLQGLSTTEAARDLGTLIGRSRHELEEVYVYGVSYGTYWAQRYLQLYPDQADGIILDSICPPGECELISRFDESFDEVGRKLLEQCATLSSCAQRLGQDPRGFLENLYQKLDQGYCSEVGLSRRTFRQLLATMLMYVGLRDYIPATIFRLDRCEPADVSAIDSLMAYLDSELNLPDPYGSEVLTFHIGLSELVQDPPPSYEDTVSHVEGLLFSLGVGPEFAALFDRWPRYQRDEYAGAFANTNIPMLMMSGEFDPQTPPEVSAPAQEHFVAAHQTYVSVPWSAHTVLTQSPVDDIENVETCGMLLIGQFLADPTLPLDTSCTNRVVGLDFDGHGPIATGSLFEQVDTWDNPGLAANTAVSALRAMPWSRWPTPAPTIRRSGPGPL